MRISYLFKKFSASDGMFFVNFLQEEQSGKETFDHSYILENSHLTLMEEWRG